jgi:signal peptidase II
MRMKGIDSSNLRSPAALARFSGVAIVALAVDLWTKSLAEMHLKFPPRSIRFIPGWIQFEYVENHGAVFGIGQGQRWLFIAVSVIAIGFVTWLFATSGRQRFYQVLLGVLLAGVLGNLYDRFNYGYVRDMIHALPGWENPFRRLYNTQEIFPWVFNVADSLLCVGVALMMIYSYFHSSHKDPPNEKTAPPAQTLQKQQ